ncbi:enoyl-ACP reductase FabI [Psychrobacter sp.]|uniref:enoyl-ACP reductase FabI n=1 Tax=Psychrobacter sp. TaxID=56811 RepID=UPI0025E2284D|nr:enoyl-ACP reductase FabI [Psychrobacter sp.]
MICDLSGKKGLIIGIANDQSIAYGCAKSMADQGAALAVTYLNEKTKSFIEPLMDRVNCEIFEPCNVQKDEELKAVFDHIRRKWGKLDFILHSIAYAPKEDLHGRVTDCSLDGFLTAMDISCHSFIRMAKLAEPLMVDGGAMLCVSFLGSERVVNHYNMMGPVKAALESTVRYLAVDLGEKGIRVNAISPGAIATRAASGINHFDQLLDKAASAPMHRLVTSDDCGAMAAFMVSDETKAITGTIIPIDAGQRIMA